IALASLDEGRNYVLTNIVGILLATLANFVGAKYFAFDPERIDVPINDAPPPPSLRPSSIPPRTRNWTAALLFAGCLGYAFVTTVPLAGLRASNEGVNVTMARNIKRS